MTSRQATWIGALLLASAIGSPARSLAQDGVDPAVSQRQTTPQLAELVELLSAERQRVASLEAELASQKEALAAINARLDAILATTNNPTIAVTSASPTQPPVVETSSSQERPRFALYGDTLVRLATLRQHYAGCSGCPDRTIGRLRLRFGAAGELAPGFRAGFGLSAGELNDPNSVYQTLGGNLGRKTATWDRAFVSYTPVGASWLELTAGKFPYNWLRSSMTFDVDFYPEGASERVSFGLNRFGVLRNVSVQGLQMVINEQANGPDTLAVGGQATASFVFGSRVATRAAFMGLDIKSPEFVLRSQLDGSNVGVRNTNATVLVAGQSFYASAFRYANLIIENNIRTPWARLPLTAAVEYQRNVRAVSTRDSAESFRLDAGRQQQRGDWAFGWHVFRVEQDAIVSALGESDWRAPSNVIQHRMAVIFTVDPHVQTLFTWYRGRTLDRDLPGAVLVPGLAPGRTEPWANRLYFDVLYRF